MGPAVAEPAAVRRPVRRQVGRAIIEQEGVDGRQARGVQFGPDRQQPFVAAERGIGIGHVGEVLAGVLEMHQTRLE